LRIEKHAHAAERLHVDDTTVPVLARNQCRTGRLWTHVRVMRNACLRHDRPFGGSAAPAAVYSESTLDSFSRTRMTEHPDWTWLAVHHTCEQTDSFEGVGCYPDATRVAP
jgi:transposase